MTAPDPAPTGEDLDVPSQIFNKTLEDLATAGVPADVIARLHKALLVDRTYSEPTLKRALFQDGTST